MSINSIWSSHTLDSDFKITTPVRWAILPNPDLVDTEADIDVLQLEAQLWIESKIWPKPKLYQWTITKTLTSKMSEWRLNYNGKSYTFVRNEWIAKSFEQMGMEIRDFNSLAEATVYLKQLFVNYKNQFPEIFAVNNWFKLSSGEMSSMIKLRAKDYNIPYAGLQFPDGSNFWQDFLLNVVPPFRVKNTFLVLSDHLHANQTFFTKANDGSAYLSVSFKD